MVSELIRVNASCAISGIKKNGAVIVEKNTVYFSDENNRWKILEFAAIERLNIEIETESASVLKIFKRKVIGLRFICSKKKSISFYMKNKNREILINAINREKEREEHRKKSEKELLKKLRKEKEEKEERARQEQIKIKAAEKERLEQLRKEKEEREERIRQEQIKIEAAKKTRQEQIKREAEEKARQERIKREAEEKARQERLKKEAEEKARLARLKKEREDLPNQPENTEETDQYIQKLDKSILSLFLSNPFRILGLSCKAVKADALNVKDKIEKMSRLNLTQSYKSTYDLKNITLPPRELSILQSSMMEMEELKYRWFWFETDTYCKIWEAKYNVIELKNDLDNNEAPKYDLFLACYLQQIIYGGDLNIIFSYLDKKIFTMTAGKLTSFLRSRMPKTEQYSDSELVASFKDNILYPINMMIESGDKEWIQKILKNVNITKYPNLKFFKDAMYSSFVTWVNNQYEDLGKYLSSVDEDHATVEQRRQILERLEELGAIEHVIEKCIQYTSGYGTFSNRIAKKVKDTVWQALVILSQNKKGRCLQYAKFIYAYCDANERRQLRNVFGYEKLNVPENSLDPDEMNSLGVKYATGDGVAVNETKAVYWYRKAAEAGDSDAQSNLAFRYLNGIGGVAENNITAKMWYGKAALQGNVNAMFGLGIIGIKENDMLQFKMWMIKAASLNHEEAQKFVEAARHDGIITPYDMARYSM